MAEQFSSEKILELVFDDVFMSDGCSSDEECSEVPSYLGNDELHPQYLNALDTTSAGEATAVMMMK